METTPPHDEAAHAHAPSLDGDDVPHHGAVLSEPRSPTWLPLLGIALLAAVLVWWLSTPSDADERAAAAAASASASASAAAVNASAPTAVVASVQPGPAPRPPPAGVPVPSGLVPGPNAFKPPPN